MKTLAKSRVLVTRFPYSCQWGGEELHTLTLVKQWDKRGISSFFLGSCPLLLKAFKDAHFETHKAWLSKPPVSKGHLLLFTLLSPLLFLWAGYLLSQARRRWKIDTVFMLSFGEKLLMTPWARLFGLKIIWIEHARIGRWLTQNPWRGFYRLWSRWAQVVVTSHAMIEQVKPSLRDGQSPVAISCGVMLDKTSPLREDLKSFLKEGFSVLCVARLTMDKGVDMLVHAVHSKPEIRLILVGEGPLVNELKKCSDPTRVRFIPSLPRGELMDLYRHADLFVLPSREMDPFGMAAAEAMSFATPVLVTSACGISQDLSHEREAWIVEPRRAEIDKAIKRLMKDRALRLRLGQAGQRFVKKHYALEKMIDAFDSLLV